LGPVVVVDGEYHGNITPTEIADVLKTCACKSELSENE